MLHASVGMEDRVEREQAEIRGHAAEQRILEALGELRPLPEVLAVIAGALEEQLRDAICSIVVPADGRLALRAAGSLPPEVAEALEGLDPSELAPALEAADPRPLVVDDVAARPDFPYREAALRHGLRALCAVPIRTPRGLFGAFVVHHRHPGAPRRHEVELTTRAANITGIVLERASGELELRESERRLRQIAENLREGIWISAIAEDRPLYISPSMERIFGLPRERLYADGLHFLEYVDPADRPRLETWLRERDELDHEFRIRRPDGEVRWLRTHIVPIRDEHGVTYRYAGVTDDITRLRRTVEALRESEAHYRRLVTSSPTGIYVLDTEGRFTEINPMGEIILERAASDIIGRHFLEVVAPADGDLAIDLFRQIAEGEMRMTRELSVVRPSGETRLLSLTVNAMDDDGRFAGLHGIAIDVTDERQRELQLRRAERLASVGTLIGGVAHELNNPLTAIRGLSELMLADEGRADDDRDVLGMIRRESERMAKIVSDLRRLAQQTQESGRECAALDLNEIVQHVLRVRRYTLKTSNVDVLQELDPQLPRVWGNPAELEQVLLNLIVNAEHALADVDVEDKRVVIRTRRSGRCVRLSVADNGPGIPADSLERIFDPFYTTKAPGEGTGLGLSLVNNIVRDHGGTVRALSRAGNGAEFVVEIPTAREERPNAPEGAAAADEAPTLRVLVVEDEPTLQSLIRRMLGRRGHQVTVASDGAEALGRIEGDDAVDYDVVLSDLRMPGLSGQELLRRLRAQGSDAAERLVFMTGDAVSDAAARVIEEAGVPVLMKPFSSEQLIGLVERVAAERVG